jgi:hypothetical protein
MATLNTLWTCVGITKHVGSNGKEVVKVRCGVDLARRIKSSQSASYVKSKGEKLKEVRTDFVSLPTPMLRLDALKFALAAPDFQSPSDQALIQDAIDSRVPKQPREKAKAEKTVKVRASKNTSPSLDSIKARVRKTKTTVEDVLSAVASEKISSETESVSAE